RARPAGRRGRGARARRARRAPPAGRPPGRRAGGGRGGGAGRAPGRRAGRARGGRLRARGGRLRRRRPRRGRGDGGPGLDDPRAARGDARPGADLPSPGARRSPAAGMTVLALAAKELQLYFTSFLFYALASVFLVLSGYYFSTNLSFFVVMGGMQLQRGLWQYQFLDMQQRLLVLLPLLTMRLFAEERKLGTLELLWTYPVRDVEIIAGKFIACLAVVTLMLAGTAVYPLMLVRLYPVAAGPLVAGYLGLWMLAAAFVACGLFVSALTEHQLPAAAAAYGVLPFSWVVTWSEAAGPDGRRRLLRRAGRGLRAAAPTPAGPQSPGRVRAPRPRPLPRSRTAPRRHAVRAGGDRVRRPTHGRAGPPRGGACGRHPARAARQGAP